ncbi:hypothetical protein KQX54_014092 [Cotesia glomerata]|uniref:Retrotransposon gag domain-containing protein n=1 Tax=Cotesia glomerata TaxID=32391 RepID=A0AAV7I7M4_COTGL|nr:hypothetical protein KQX54_014092 [Cotesia glomerata]
MAKKNKSSRRRAARFEQLNLSNISEKSQENANGSSINESEIGNTTEYPLDATINQPKVTNVQAVALVPEICERLWTDEEAKNWSQLNPKLLSSTPPSDNLKNMSANEERLFQLIREIPRRSLGVPVSSITRSDAQPAQNQSTGLDDSPVHHSSRVPSTGAGDNARNNTSGNQPHDQEDLIALEKLARARNLGFSEKEAQPKIYLQELQEFKAEQQMPDKEALSLVKALFAKKTHIQWLRLSSHRLTIWEDFVNAFTVYFIQPRADSEISAEIYNKYQAADQEARVFIDDMQKLFMVMTSPPSEEIQRRENFIRRQGSDYRQNKNGGRRINYAVDVRNSDFNRCPKVRIPLKPPNHCECNPETKSFTSQFNMTLNSNLEYDDSTDKLT